MDNVDFAQSYVENIRNNEIRSIQTQLRTHSSHKHCRDCEEPIGLDRRRAAPNAIRCMECERDKERQKRLYR
ncbi:TraR/DksA C4-type zinc finger protein [Flexibacterium corallicola]|uniref:TraR/DksA C4-type zinc finger protein n=1 Tax=Flexibacterium corallicola TaxID=3037259 RepID=UPI0038621405